MAIGQSIKLAGPDRGGDFKVLQVKNTARLLPGDIMDGTFVTAVVVDLKQMEGIDVTIVEYVNDSATLEKFGIEASPTLRESVGGKVRGTLR